MAGYLAETPWMFVIISTLFTCAMISLWIQSQARICLVLAAVGTLMTIVPLIVASLLQSPGEVVHSSVRRMCDCVRRNDVGGLLEFVDPGAGDLRNQIEREFPRYQFSACNVAGSIQVQPVAGTSDELLATFNVFVSVDAPRYNHTGPAMRNVSLGFRKQADGSWKVFSLVHRPIQL